MMSEQSSWSATTIEKLKGLVSTKFNGLSQKFRNTLFIVKCDMIEEKPKPLTKKVFNDSVHGHIQLHPLCVKIVDTPQFQRLRYLKQLGAGYFVYPGAAHNRFEHSLGVCHLAGKLCRHFKENQRDLGITTEDVLCVEIAGLCHDLGHGPFSHMFDNQFMPAVQPEKKWKHEDGSVAMFDHMLKENNLRKEFSKYGLNDQDITFIKEQIAGPLNESQQTGKQRDEPPGKSQNEWPYKGRDKKKSFLYEIVANKRNSIDVDKWDYFARDCHGLGIRNHFDHNRFSTFARVINVDESLQICTRDKEAETVYSMFQVRATLHKYACKHRVVRVIEHMITDAFIKADKKKFVPGKDGNLLTISKCIDDPVAFTNLNDSIFHTILMSTDKDLEESRAILNRIQKRDLYTFVGETDPIKNKTKVDLAEMKKEIESKIVKEGKLTKNDIVVDVVYFDFGMENQKPLENVRFYNKYDINTAVSLTEDQVSQMLPKEFSEQLIRLYCKKKDKKSIEMATKLFKKWRDDNKY